VDKSTKNRIKMKARKPMSHYTEEFKWKVVKEVLSGRYNKEQARLIYGIKSNCAILYWMRKYSGNEDYRYTHSFANGINDMDSSKSRQELQQKVEQLEAELRQANLRADLWQKMIEIAEKQLHIEIKKKYGAQLLKDTEDRTDQRAL
jgi:transposase